MMRCDSLYDMIDDPYDGVRLEISIVAASTFWIMVYVGQDK